MTSKTEMYLKVFDQIVNHLDENQCNIYDKAKLLSHPDGLLINEEFIIILVVIKGVLEPTGALNSSGYYWCKLSQLGIKVKEEGGYFAYKKQIEKEDEIEKQRKKIDNDLKLEQQQGQRFTKKTGKATIIITGIVIILALIVNYLIFLRK